MADAFTTAAITSTPANGTDYRAGETITIRLTGASGIEFRSLGTGNNTPTLAIQVGADSRSASAALTTPFSNQVNFSYTLTAADYDSDGITVARNALTGQIFHRHPPGSTVSLETSVYTSSNNALPNTLVSAQASHKVNSHLTNYDTDGDNLIEVDSLAKLNAIRHDLNGNGVQDSVSASDWANYTTAFPDAAPRMGCPRAAGCLGYELDADLDFDTGTAGDRTDDQYYNAGAGWTPIGRVGTGNHYSGDFEGNGHTISNLYINSGLVFVGLFGWTTGDISGVGLPDADVTITTSTVFGVGTLSARLSQAGTVTSCWATGSVTATSTDPTDANNKAIGGLVGSASHNNTVVRASWANVTVSGEATVGGFNAGGLVGRASTGASVIASYARGAVSGGQGTNVNKGGLVGYIGGAGATVTASYATGSVSGNSSAGLVGTRGTAATVTNSYWDTITGPSTSSGGGTGRNTSQLQMPTEYGTTGIYSTWNVNVDGVSGADDPWHFGSGSQYPVLQFGYDAIGVDRQRGGAGDTDYDANDNNLIDVATLAQLDAIRHDVDGSGEDGLTGSSAGAYAHGFPRPDAGDGLRRHLRRLRADRRFGL